MPVPVHTGIFRYTEFWEIMASQLTQSQVKAIKEVFDSFDENGDGWISYNELNNVMRQLGRHITPEDLRLKFTMIDEDGDGKIEFNEFLEIASDIFRSPWDDSDIKRTFEMFDRNGDGKINAVELRRVAQGSGIAMNDAQLEAMIKEADTNGDGQVSYEEFYSIMKS